MAIALCVLALVAVACGYYILLLHGRKTQDQGQREPPDRTGPWVCGGRFDSENWTLPFVTVTLLDEWIEIKYRRSIRLRYDAIERVELYRRLFSRGVRVLHRDPTVPQHLILWSLMPRRLLESIELHLRKPHDVCSPGAGDERTANE